MTLDQLLQLLQDRGVGFTILVLIILFIVIPGIPAARQWLSGELSSRRQREEEDRQRRYNIDERMVKAWERLSEQMGNMSMVLNLLTQRLENMEDDMGLMRDQLNIVADRMAIKRPISKAKPPTE